VQSLAEESGNASPFPSNWNEASDDAKQPKQPRSPVFDTELVLLHDRGKPGWAQVPDVRSGASKRFMGSRISTPKQS